MQWFLFNGLVVAVGVVVVRREWRRQLARRLLDDVTPRALWQRVFLGRVFASFGVSCCAVRGTSYSDHGPACAYAIRGNVAHGEHVHVEAQS